MILKLLKISWPFLLIIVFVITFFAKLFFPPSIFITPDYGRSDILHFNIPVKSTLSQSLKNWGLPLWEPKIGQGFAMFDEGQVGALFLPNVVLFSALPFWLAFNLGYVVTFSTAAIGTYLLARSTNLGKISSITAGIVFAYSAIFALHLHHYNLIQTASLTPWLFWLVNSFFNSKKLIFLMFLPIFVSGQIFAGFPQITFYSLFGLLLFFIYRSLTTIKSLRLKLKIGSVFLFAIVLGSAIATPQLVATYTITNESQRLERTNPQKILTDFPFKYTNLKTIINPYILGNPKNASYPRWQPGKWGLFWENNLYFGFVPIVIIALYLIYLAFARKALNLKNPLIFWMLFAALGLLLALGPYAPFHPIFSIPPFSYFRVPSRFLIFTFLSAAIVCAMAIDSLSRIFKKSQLIKISSLTVTIAVAGNLLLVWSPNNPITPVGEWFTPPQTSYQLQDATRIFSFGQEKNWNNIYLNHGWENQKEFFLSQKNYLERNTNINFGTSQLLVYGGITPRRNQIIERLALFDIKEEEGLLQIGPVTQNTLNFSAVSHLISQYSLNNSNWQEVTSVEDEDQKFYVYKNISSLPQVFVVRDFTTAQSLQDVTDILKNPQFNPRETVILENTLDEKFEQSHEPDQLKITSYEPNRVAIETSLATAAIVILSDSFYPGWKATIDNHDAPILPANVNSRALVVERGTHLIVFKYNRQDLKIAAVAAISSFSLWLVLTLLGRKIKFQ